MLKNYFLVAIRNCWRNKVFSTINVLGLSIGIGASLVLFMIVYYEFSFDKFERDGDRIYRVITAVNQEGEKKYTAAVPAPLGSAAASEITGLAQTVPLFQFQGDATVNVSVQPPITDKPIVYKNQPAIIFTTDDYFSMLQYQWLAGSPQTALKQPFSVVLSESRAKKYFPGLPVQEMLGQTVTYGDTLTTTITGIVKDLDERTFFTRQEFISVPTIMTTGLKDNFMMETWNDWMAYSQLFVKTTEGTSKEGIEANLNRLLAKYKKGGNGPDYSFVLQPLSDVHFNYASIGQRTAHKPTLFGLLAVAVFLLLLGCINFINLTTAKSVQRAKEIGIRKTIGSSQRQLIVQFLSETFFITLAAAALAIAAIPLLLNMFRSYIPEGLKMSMLTNPSSILFLFCLVIAVSLFSGLYPAMILARFLPVTVLKTQHGGQHFGRAWLRKTLTVVQFVIAQFFVIATVMVSKQISYTLNKDLGYKKEAIINFSLPRDTSETARYVLLNKLNAIPEVQLTSLGFLPPASDGPAYTNVSFSEAAPDTKPNVQIRWGDTNYLSVYGIKLLAGRNVMQSDTIKEFLINETFARTMGYSDPAQAVGKQLRFNDKLKPVVGVMGDFHESSLHAPIEPVVFAAFNSRSNFFHVALKPMRNTHDSWQSAIPKIENAFKQVYPDKDFTYSFFDETIAKFYTAEQATAHLLRWATGLAILISCLGLLGLAIYTINARRKEIGIRKVMGASVPQITSLLTLGFIRLVLIAFVIAAPAAWWAVHNWLQDFDYRTEMSGWVFLLSGLLMLIIAGITVGVQTVQAALSNPVKSLRTE